MNSRMLIFGIFAAAAAVASAMLFKLPNFFDVSPAAQHPSETMMAVVYRSRGDASVLEYTNVPKPVPKSTQYLIKVEASALNPVDYKMRRNPAIPEFVMPLPKIPGADMAGVVVQTPVDQPNNKFQVGDRVAALMPVSSKWGSHAEYAAIDEDLLAKIGDDVSFADAASIPLVGLTVVQNFANLQESPQPGDKILVQAGAGGVGSFAIQYASKVLGMEVATTASAPKAQLLEDLGASLVVDYRTQKFEDVIQNYDVVLDSMSWLYEERTLHTGVLKPSGHYLNVPSSDSKFLDGIEKANGARTYMNAALSKLKNAVKPDSSPRYGLVFVNPNGTELQGILDLMEGGKINAVIDRSYHISEAAEAYRYLEEGHATGKVVLYGDKTQQQP